MNKILNISTLIAMAGFVISTFIVMAGFILYFQFYEGSKGDGYYTYDPEVIEASLTSHYRAKHSQEPVVYEGKLRLAFQNTQSYLEEWSKAKAVYAVGARVGGESHDITDELISQLGVKRVDSISQVEEFRETSYQLIDSARNEILSEITEIKEKQRQAEMIP